MFGYEFTGAMGWGMGFGGVFMLLILAVVTLAIVALVKYIRSE